MQHLNIALAAGICIVACLVVRLFGWMEHADGGLLHWIGARLGLEVLGLIRVVVSTHGFDSPFYGVERLTSNATRGVCC
jgi:hypothetical protein